MRVADYYQKDVLKEMGRDIFTSDLNGVRGEGKRTFGPSFVVML